MTKVKKNTTTRFSVSAAAYREVAIQTRKAYHDLAAMIERGATLNEHDRRTIAAVLRNAAGSLSTGAPKGEGQPAQYSHGSAALRWAWLQHHDGMKPTPARDQVAEEYEVSTTAIQNVIEEHGEWALAQFARVPKRKR